MAGILQFIANKFGPLVTLNVSPQDPLPIAIYSASTSAGGVSPITTGFSNYRNTAATSTKSEIKASSGEVYGLKVINPNTAPVYVKFYNAPSASVTVGTTTPQHVVAVPAGDGTTPGIAWITPDIVPAMSFSTGITIAVVTELADSGTTAPSTAVNIEAIYK